MPDDLDPATGQAPVVTPPAPATPPATPPVTPPAAAPTLGSDGQPFDPERAARTIANLRVKEKELGEAKALIAAFEKTKKDAEDATLSETARLAKQVEEGKLALAEANKAAATRVTRLAVELAASKANLANPALAYRLIDTSEITFDKEGHPTNVEALLTDLVKDNPYLVKAAPPPPTPEPPAAPPAAPAAPGIRPTNGTGSAASGPAAGRRYTQAEVGDYRFYSEHKADIGRAMAEGRIDP